MPRRPCPKPSGARRCGVPCPGSSCSSWHCRSSTARSFSMRARRDWPRDYRGSAISSVSCFRRMSGRHGRSGARFSKASGRPSSWRFSALCLARSSRCRSPSLVPRTSCRSTGCGFLQGAVSTPCAPSNRSSLRSSSSAPSVSGRLPVSLRLRYPRSALSRNCLPRRSKIHPASRSTA